MEHATPHLVTWHSWGIKGRCRALSGAALGVVKILQALVLQAPSVKAKEEVVPQALAIKYEVEKDVPQALTKRQKSASVRLWQKHAQF